MNSNYIQGKLTVILNKFNEFAVNLQWIKLNSSVFFWIKDEDELKSILIKGRVKLNLKQRNSTEF